MKKKLNLLTAECGAGKTEQLIKKSLNRLRSGKTTIIAQPSISQTIQTKARIIEHLDRIQSSIDRGQIVVYTSDGEGDNADQRIQDFIESRVTSENASIVIITHASLLNIPSDLNLSQVEIHLDETVKVVDCRSMNLSDNGHKFAEIFACLQETQVPDTDFSILSIKDSNSNLIMNDFIRNENNDSVTHRLSNVLYPVLNDDVVCFVKTGTLDNITNAHTPYNFTKLIHETLKSIVVGGDVMPAFTGKVTEKQLESLKQKYGSRLFSNRELSVSDREEIENELISNIEKMSFVMHNVLKPSILTRFEEVNIYAAKIEDTEMSKIWGLYRDEEFDVNDTLHSLSDTARIITMESIMEKKWHLSQVSLKQHFDITDIMPFKKHSQKVVIHTLIGNVHSKSSRKMNDGEDTVLDIFKKDFLDSVGENEEYVYLDNNFWKARAEKAIGKKEFKNGRYLTHNMQGQNDHRHTTKGIIMTSLNPNPIDVAFYNQILGIDRECLTILRHLDIYYQSIMRIGIRNNIQNDPTEYHIWILNNYLAAGLEEYFENISYVYVRDTQNVITTIVPEKDLKIIKQLWKAIPEFTDYTAEEIYKMRMPNETVGLGVKLSKFTRTFKDLTSHIGTNGNILKVSGAVFSSNQALFQYYKESLEYRRKLQTKVKDPKYYDNKGNLKGTVRTKGKNIRSNAVKNGFPILENMETCDIIELGLIEDFNTRGNPIDSKDEEKIEGSAKEFKLTPDNFEESTHGMGIMDRALLLQHTWATKLEKNHAA